MMGATHQYSSIEQPTRKATSDACVQVLALAAIIVGFTLIVATIFCLVQTFGISPSYSVTINSVSGLDPATDLGHKAALHPEFNLTLGVTSWRYWAQACADLGVYVEVSYRDVLLATSSTLMQQICAGPRDAVKHPFIVRGAGVVIPGPLLDSFAMDMLSGVPEFDVKLHGPCPRKRMWPCGPRMVGDADALRAECGMYH